MTQSDSFIDEVTEEVRRERLWRYARRYGWIPLLAVVLIVGTAAVVEWRRAQALADARTFGDRLAAALDQTAPAATLSALDGLAGNGVQGAVARLLEAGVAAGTDAERAGAALEAVIADAALPQVFRDLAVLKLVTLRDYPLFTDDRLARLDPLTAPGRPLRLLALEQQAVLQADSGDRDAALATLQAIAEDFDAPPTQRQRVLQLLTVLGGDLDDG